ncbi:unnamed protein product [marine sediment metagenome]|uniref:Uncharacterized protein n=1 Tax=marine sediment metagenome TaxID=412755 RepID=X1JMZ3_9ZZZZ
MKEHTILSLFAIGAITLLEVVALLKGVDGAMLMLTFTLVGGIAGYEIKGFQNKRF